MYSVEEIIKKVTPISESKFKEIVPYFSSCDELIKYINKLTMSSMSVVNDIARCIYYDVDANFNPNIMYATDLLEEIKRHKHSKKYQKILEVYIKCTIIIKALKPEWQNIKV